MRLRIPEGGVVPWYYGVGYMDLCYRDAVCYIIPFNFVVRAWMKFARFKNSGEKYYPPSPDLLEKEYQRGLKDAERHWLEYIKALCDNMGVS